MAGQELVRGPEQGVTPRCRLCKYWDSVIGDDGERGLCIEERNDARIDWRADNTGKEWDSAFDAGAGWALRNMRAPKVFEEDGCSCFEAVR